MNKKALVVISFGTTYPDAMAAIEKIEQRLHNAMPDYDLFRAFTSGMVIRKLQKAQGIAVESPEQLLIRLAEQGYDEIVCQSTHVINGVEYDKMCYQISGQAHKFTSVKLGKPLLSDVQDYIDCCALLMKEVPALGNDEALVLMGHGTDHFANGAYSQLENTFRSLGYERVYVGTVEGFPNLDYVLGRLDKHEIKKVVLMPFMIVAGDHAQNDMAGDDEDSWKMILEQKGYQTQILLQGLGSLDGIGNLFAEHLKKAEEL
ncbi:sirohydrochlorin cobaltochelatase [Hydrogenoanaerobacterium saccharovorans]|uniref:Sirohydrochlorin cobaltochelatase n=1 Tax=Hydrogenoanaerobacterium saccharovorans TaxID=474960 RepID=A0A1H8AHX1_9FIRM|nr:sirohydrochlorin cobaltochelatase [Hydrogenoanaerobacterium saccharovorans]RPF47944.1 sirohydrochlorin cobaltochelatase [Hydrogenoanaerobacterium saccharovorans]SEM70133.1 sirohydrochlorin cobaltochelatase [Hydrogenoanaerobacterium saccharovorans]